MNTDHIHQTELHRTQGVTPATPVLPFQELMGFPHCGPTSPTNDYQDPSDETIPPEVPVAAGDSDNDVTMSDPFENLTRHRVQHFTPPTDTYGRAPNTLEIMDLDAAAVHRTNNVFYPFGSKEEWELAKFLSTSLTQTQQDQFLKLDWVSAFNKNVQLF